MSEVTAEMIERGRGGDPRIVAGQQVVLQLDPAALRAEQIAELPGFPDRFVPVAARQRAGNAPLAAARERDQAGGVLDVHMMVNRPDQQIGEFAKAGADSITFHYEATPHVHRTLGAIRDLGCLAGIAINPGTPVDAVSQLDGMADLVLAMSVNPGWGGQKFIRSSPEKIARMRRIVGEIPLIEVDGGVDVNTAASVTEAGATLLVAGSAVFGADDPAQAFADIASVAESA